MFAKKLENYRQKEKNLVGMVSEPTRYNHEYRHYRC
jgi:hypothetical protein